MSYRVSTIGELPGLKGQPWPEIPPEWVTPKAAEALGVAPSSSSVNGVVLSGVVLGGVLAGALGLWALARYSSKR